MSAEKIAVLAAALQDVLRVFDAPFSTSPEQRRRIRERAERALAPSIPSAESAPGLNAETGPTFPDPESTTGRWTNATPAGAGDEAGTGLRVDVKVDVTTWRRLQPYLPVIAAEYRRLTDAARSK